MSSYRNYEEGLVTEYTFLQNAVLDYPKTLFAAEPVVPNSKPKFSCQFALDPAGVDLAAIKSLMGVIASNRAKLDPEFPADFSVLHWPIKSGDDEIVKKNARRKAEGKEPRAFPWLAGKVLLTARSDYAPSLGRIVNGKLAVLKDDARAAAATSLFFLGAEVLGTVKFKSFRVGNNQPGLNCYLVDVLGTGKGERYGGDGSGAMVNRYQHMTGHIGHVSQENPLRSQEIPF